MDGIEQLESDLMTLAEMLALRYCGEPTELMIAGLVAVRDNLIEQIEPSTAQTMRALQARL